MLRSRLPFLLWPALPNAFDAQVVSLLYQFEETEWWPAEQLESFQYRQLAALLTHFNRTSDFFRPRLEGVVKESGRALTPEILRRIPLLTRNDIRTAGPALFNRDLPVGHQEFRHSSSSGSSGPPVTIWKTEVNQVFHEALNLRNHIWHGRDFRESFASIRRFPHGTSMFPDGGQGEGWITSLQTGPSLALNSAFCTIAEQAEWLQRVRPGYLFSYPSLLAGLALHCERAGIAMPWLKGFMTFGEVVTKSQREVVARVFGASIRDTYSASEVSKIAIQCPEVETNLHVQSESVIVEILDDAGRPCGVGEPGRVVITDLHNFATPMIRYEIGDMAALGPPCSCGRGLPVLQRVVGRTLNLLRLPDGDALIPDIERQELHTLAPIREAQVVQTGFGTMEVRLVAERALTGEEEAAVRAAIRHGLHDREFELTLVYLDAIPRAQSGKFEAFICRVGTPLDRPAV